KEVGDAVTYVFNRNINFTNVCNNFCKFCAFSKPESSPGAYTLSKKQVSEKVRKAVDRGATEICFQGGINPKLDFEDYLDYLRAIREVSEKVHIHAYSPSEIHHMKKKSGLDIEEVLKILKDEGLNSVPGTAAEILVDRVRKIICPNRISAKRWEEIIRMCHKLGIPTSATLMYGHVETPREIAIHLNKIREIQKDTGGFTELVPLAFASENTQLQKEGLVKDLGPEYHLKIHAVSRLMLSGWIRNIQTSWVKLGPELAKRTLNAGANDFSGTLMEENITGAAGGKFNRLEPEEIRKLISEKGKIPVERTTTYNHVKK
ncbi:hypothetical protein AKJ55_01555, partial [candidate division MSBL1 archaeon SCGC-AAA382M17]